MNRKLSDGQQRGLALALLVMALLLFYFGLPYPYMQALQGMDSEINELQDKLSRYRAVGALRGDLQMKMVELHKNTQIRSQFLSQNTPALAAAHLQTLIKQRVVESGGQLLSTQSLGDKQQQGFKAITVKVAMRGSSQNLYDVLQRLEQQKPLMQVDELNIQRTRVYSTVSSVQTENLMISFNVSAYMWEAEHE